MTIGILTEPAHETRVSLLADAIPSLIKKNINVLVEKGAGVKAFCADTEYEKAGARIVSRTEVLAGSDIILSIHQPTRSEIENLKGKVLLGVYQPLYGIDIMKEWASKGVTTFSLDMLPRTTRAQSMDVLSSQANIAGYKAVLTAANMYGRYFPMFMTAAGSIKPAKVLILDAVLRACRQLLLPNDWELL